MVEKHHTSEHPAELTTREARQGETSGHLRTIMFVSLALIVVIYGAFYIWRIAS